MSSKQYGPRLKLRPRNVPYVKVCLILVYSLALASVLLAGLPTIVSASLSAIVLGSLALGLWRPVCTLRMLVWKSAGPWLLIGMDGRAIDAVLADAVVFGSRVIWLRFRTEAGQTHSLLLLPGMLSADCFRELRTRLRLEAFQDLSDG